MAVVRYDAEAAAALDRLVNDAARRTLWERVNDGLDLLENDPGDARVRRHRFADPPLWAFTIAGDDEEWVILWQPDPDSADAVIVEYLGSSNFGTF